MVDTPVMATERILAARMEPFDSFWEAPEDIQRGYGSFGRFYRANYVAHLPTDRTASILVISCGPGYFVKLLAELGYTDVLGIDSDENKTKHATDRGLNCRVQRAFEFLESEGRPFDVIFCEQELNHLTKAEMVEFLGLCRRRLNDGGRLIVHGLNGANPISGAEALAQNFDHFNTFTAYSLRQVLEHTGYEDVRVFPLHLYVFYGNPMNYVAWLAAGVLNVLFRAAFILYGKSNRIWTKKIGGVCTKPAAVTCSTGFQPGDPR
ncbi:MAG: class I SAM-dependent methyltransferase [Phycisphaerae bacterium]